MLIERFIWLKCNWQILVSLAKSESLWPLLNSNLKKSDSLKIRLIFEKKYWAFRVIKVFSLNAFQDLPEDPSNSTPDVSYFFFFGPLVRDTICNLKMLGSIFTQLRSGHRPQEVVFLKKKWRKCSKNRILESIFFEIWQRKRFHEDFHKIFMRSHSSENNRWFSSEAFLDF